MLAYHWGLLLVWLWQAVGLTGRCTEDLGFPLAPARVGGAVLVRRAFARTPTLK